MTIRTKTRKLFETEAINQVRLQAWVADDRHVGVGTGDYTTLRCGLTKSFLELDEAEEFAKWLLRRVKEMRAELK